MSKIGVGGTTGQITFSWTQENFGFGQLSIYSEGPVVRIDNEAMSTERVRALMHAWVDAVVDAAVMDSN